MLKKTNRYRKWFRPFLLALVLFMPPMPGHAQSYKPDMQALSDNGERLAVLDNGMLRLRFFDAVNRKLLWEQPLPEEGQAQQKPKVLALSPGGQAVYLETETGVYLFGAEKGELFQVYRGMHPRQFALADSAAGTILAAYLDVTDSQVSATSLIFHNATTGTILTRADKVIRSFYLHPSGALASYRGQYEQPVILNLFGGKETPVNVDAVVSAVSGSGKLALLNDRHFYDRLLHIRNGSQIGEEKRLPKYHHAFFSPDEKFLLMDCATEILVYDTADFAHVVSISKKPLKVEFDAKGELEAVTPRYPLGLLRSLSPEYQHQMDKEFNAL